MADKRMKQQAEPLGLYNKIIYAQLDNLENKTLEEITQILTNDPTKRRRVQQKLSRLKCNNKITYILDNGIYSNFQLLDHKEKEAKELKACQSELAQIKVMLYVDDVLNMNAIANNTSIRATERIKATELKQRALKFLDSPLALKLLKMHMVFDDIDDIEALDEEEPTNDTKIPGQTA